MLPKPSPPPPPRAQFNEERLLAERREKELQALETEFESLLGAQRSWDACVYQGGGGAVPNTDEAWASSRLTPDQLLARIQVAEESVNEVGWQTRELNFMGDRLAAAHKKKTLHADAMSGETAKLEAVLVNMRKELKRAESQAERAGVESAAAGAQMEMMRSVHRQRMDTRRAIDGREQDLARAAEERAMRAATVIPNMIREEMAKADLEERQRHIVQQMHEQAWMKKYEEMEDIMNKLHRLQVVLGVSSVEELIVAVEHREGRTRRVEADLAEAERRKEAALRAKAEADAELKRSALESGRARDAAGPNREDALLRDLGRSERRIEAAVAKVEASHALIAKIYTGLIAVHERFDATKLDGHRTNFSAMKVSIAGGKGVTKAGIQWDATIHGLKDLITNIKAQQELEARDETATPPPPPQQQQQQQQPASSVPPRRMSGAEAVPAGKKLPARSRSIGQADGALPVPAGVARKTSSPEQAPAAAAGRRSPSQRGKRPSTAEEAPSDGSVFSRKDLLNNVILCLDLLETRLLRAEHSIQNPPAVVAPAPGKLHNSRWALVNKALKRVVPSLQRQEDLLEAPRDDREKRAPGPSSGRNNVRVSSAPPAASEARGGGAAGGAAEVLPSPLAGDDEDEDENMPDRTNLKLAAEHMMRK